MPQLRGNEPILGLNNPIIKSPKHVHHFLLLLTFFLLIFSLILQENS
jgi:hypothetical protein